MADPSRQRAFALEIVEKLRAAGFEALWAGGCVRDQLLGFVPKDYDVATSATPDEIRNLFGRRRTLPIGAAFGVVTVIGPRAAGQIEVATFRADAAYSDGRHPDAVTFTTAEHDAQRRDFTINGLFYDPIAGNVVDYVDGQQDIQRRIVRAIGDPRLRLGEDKLRMLRAVRFAATFGFEIEAETFRAIQDMAGDITTVSPERIGMEIRRMLVDPNRGRALELLRDSKLLPHVLPEAGEHVTRDIFREITRILQVLSEPTLPLALAAVLCTERAVPDSANSVAAPISIFEGVQNLPGCRIYSSTHDGKWRLAPDCAQDVARRLRFTKKEADRATWLLKHLSIIDKSLQMPWPQLQRILTQEGAVELVALHAAITGPNDPAIAFCRERLAWPPERLNPPTLIDGAALIEHGLTPGPQFAALLDGVRDAQLEGQIRSRDEALALVDRLREASDTLG
jgi:hypothetical protein